MIWLHTPQMVQSHLQKWIPFDSPPKDTQMIKSSASRMVVKAPLDDNRTVFIKRYRIQSFGHMLVSLFHASKARREFLATQMAQVKGISVATVLAAAEQRVTGFLRESYLVLEAIEPSKSLEELLTKDFATWEKKAQQDFLSQLCRYLVEVQEKGFKHDDFRSDHILIRQSPGIQQEFALIDLDGAKDYGAPLHRDAIIHNLVQLNRSLWREVPTPWQRLQFLREFTKVHPRLKNETVSRLWHEVAFLSALRKSRVAPPLRLAYRICFHFTGKIPESLRPWLKKKA